MKKRTNFHKFYVTAVVCLRTMKDLQRLLQIMPSDQAWLHELYEIGEQRQEERMGVRVS